MSSERVLKLLETAGRDTTPDGEALNAVRLARAMMARTNQSFETLFARPTHVAPAPRAEFNTPLVEWKRRVETLTAELASTKTELAKSNALSARLLKENESLRASPRIMRAAAQVEEIAAKVVSENMFEASSSTVRTRSDGAPSRKPRPSELAAKQAKTTARVVEEAVKTSRPKPKMSPAGDIDFSSRDTDFRLQLHEIMSLLLKNEWGASDKTSGKRNTRMINFDPIVVESSTERKLGISSTGKGLTTAQLRRFADQMAEKSKSFNFLSMLVRTRHGDEFHEILLRKEGRSLVSQGVRDRIWPTTAETGNLSPLDTTRWHRLFDMNDFVEIVILGDAAQNTAFDPFKTGEGRTAVFETLFSLYYDPKDLVARHGGGLLDVKITNSGTNERGSNLCASGHRFAFMSELETKDSRDFVSISPFHFEDGEDVGYRFYESRDDGRSLYRTRTAAKGERIAFVKGGRMFNAYEDEDWLARQSKFGITKPNVSVLINLPDDHPAVEVDGVLYNSNMDQLTPEMFASTIAAFKPAHL